MTYFLPLPKNHINGKLSPLNDIPEHTSTLENNQNTYYPLSASYPKQVWDSRKRVFCFYCDRSAVAKHGAANFSTAVTSVESNWHQA